MSDLIPRHGGYRKLKSFQLAQLVYDITVRFVDRYIDRFSRTKDQMVQAARSGVQNIAEGSLASATSKKTELKLTQVARASLEELRLDYEDFLRHKGEPIFEPNHSILLRLKHLKPQTLDEFAKWVAEERKIITDFNKGVQTSKSKENLSYDLRPFSSACIAANGVLSLLNLTCYFLDRQVEHLAQEFEENGGFTERLYKVRTGKRGKQ